MPPMPPDCAPRTIANPALLVQHALVSLVGSAGESLTLANVLRCSARAARADASQESGRCGQGAPACPVSVLLPLGSTALLMPLLGSLYATHLDGARRHSSRAKSLCLKTVVYIGRNNSPWSIHLPVELVLPTFLHPFRPSSSQNSSLSPRQAIVTRHLSNDGHLHMPHCGIPSGQSQSS
ncbi:hypothetical protein IWZ00DRAFT_506818 [Phyllosticta capitalensis]